MLRRPAANEMPVEVILKRSEANDEVILTYQSFGHSACRKVKVLFKEITGGFRRKCGEDLKGTKDNAEKIISNWK